MNGKFKNCTDYTLLVFIRRAPYATNLQLAERLRLLGYTDATAQAVRRRKRSLRKLGLLANLPALPKPDGVDDEALQ